MSFRTIPATLVLALLLIVFLSWSVGPAIGIHPLVLLPSILLVAVGLWLLVIWRRSHMAERRLEVMLADMDAQAKRLAEKISDDDDGLVCFFGRTGTNKSWLANRLRLYTSVPCFDDIRNPVVAQNWARHGSRVAFLTIQAASAASAEAAVEEIARQQGIALPSSLVFVETPSMKMTSGKKLRIPGATGPDNGYGPTVTIEDLERNPELAAQYRRLTWPGSHGTDEGNA